jgi:hypothetical protein
MARSVSTAHRFLLPTAVALIVAGVVPVTRVIVLLVIHRSSRVRQTGSPPSPHQLSASNDAGAGSIAVPLKDRYEGKVSQMSLWGLFSCPLLKRPSLSFSGVGTPES